MSDSRVASRYAKSLLELAIERDELEKAHNEMMLIFNTVEDSRDLELLMKSPVVKQDVKHNVIKGIFGDKLSEMTSNFLEIILRKGRESILKQIANEFVSQYKEHLGIVTAHVTTAFELDDEMRKKILESVKSAGGSKVDLIESIDKDIIGGIIVRVEDRQVDASVQRKLNDLRRDFADNPYVADF